MKIKLLLFLMLMAGGLVSAQDTIRTLMITEAHLGGPGRNLLELTNMGDEPVQLSNFEVGRNGSNTFAASEGQYMMLPEKELQPGESFFIAVVVDRGREVYEEGIYPEGFGIGPATTPPEIIELADVQIHIAETPQGKPSDPALDSVSPNNPISMYFGRQCVYVEQHFPNGDSLVVDQVMGVFDTENDDGSLSNRSIIEETAYDVAGFPIAGQYGLLIRKFSVKQGNLEFVRGNSEEDSEWIVLPNISGAAYRAQPWTYKNHGDYNLVDTMLQSDVVDVDFDNKVLTVPWGTRKPDGIMELMEKKPGIYWSYIMSPNKMDSLSFACKTGDRIEIVVCGNDADRDTFDIVVRDPGPSENKVVPMLNEDPDADYAGAIMTGHVPGWPRIVEVEGGMDTITGAGIITNLGVPNALRIDTLLERLEKPENATWEIVPVDGNETRPDLLDGDILKVTAEDESVREYYIKVKRFEGEHNAFLSYITWPDIPDPEFFEGVYGWKGDTIPNFRPNTFNYQLKLPPDVEDVPATAVRTQHPNAKVEVKRATNLLSVRAEDRTTIYTVTAEDDTSIVEYRIEWQKEQLPSNVQPYNAEPFISEFIMRYYFADDFLEICNPGNQILDLSDYMIAAAWTTNPAEAITFNPEDWGQRYQKYVPGYKWVDEATWATKPGYLEEDLGVNPIVQPGDVFCLSEITRNGWFGYGSTGWTKTDHPSYNEADVQFYNNDWPNPWGEDVTNGEVPIAQVNSGEVQYIFKILNDSVKEGLKPATDPNDFELIETIGNADGTTVLFGYDSKLDGHNFTTFIRKPEFVFPVPELEKSFGFNEQTRQWKRVNRRTPEGVGGWPEQWSLTPMLDWGKHFFIPTTDHLSTVSSNIYEVSEGYETENIWGVITGATVNDLMRNIFKANEEQETVVKSGSDGAELGMDDELANGDTLLVTSANGESTTKYVLDVTDEGLSSDAVLTSGEYTVNIEVEPTLGNEFMGMGSVTGFEYGTTLTTVLSNLTVPAGAELLVLDKEGHFVPTKVLNFDTVYVDATVNDSIMLHVVAEDNITTIDYWLKPNASPDDAIVVSDYYNVIQETNLIEYVPDGVSVTNFVNRLTPSAGATIKVIDKSGLERTTGIVRLDDKVVVTSASGEVTNTYFLSFLSATEEVFLVYVVSDVYEVDQVNHVIQGVTTETMLSDFINNVEASEGASILVVDKDGVEKPTDEILNTDDQVKVSSSDGKIEVTYSLDLVSDVEPVTASDIRLYPNPTNEVINISGLEAGGKIQVFNSIGTMIRDINVNNNIETVSLREQPAGMYIILVSDSEKLIGRYKAIKR